MHQNAISHAESVFQLLEQILRWDGGARVQTDVGGKWRDKAKVSRGEREQIKWRKSKINIKVSAGEVKHPT